MDVKLMHRQGHSLRRIARMTGLSRVTVRRILSAAAPKGYGPRAKRPGKLAAFLGWLEARLKERPRATASWLYRGLLGKGFAGSYTTVKRWVHERRREERARERACVRFETAPGLEGQFDWKGPVAGLIAGAPEIGVHFFRFVLAWSRARWTLVVPDLKLPATLAALQWAFERAGGVPYRLVLDNPKTCVTRPKPHLELHVPRTAWVRLELFDIQGRLMGRLADRLYEPGQWSVEWDRRTAGGGVAKPGVYLYRMTAGDFRSEKKLIVMP